jgi:hypothetical protein
MVGKDFFGASVFIDNAIGLKKLEVMLGRWPGVQRHKGSTEIVDQSRVILVEIFAMVTSNGALAAGVLMTN